MAGPRKAKAVPTIKGGVSLGGRTYYAGEEEELQEALNNQPEVSEGRRGQKVSRQTLHANLARSGAIENFELDLPADFDPELVDEPDATIRAGNAFRSAKRAAANEGPTRGKNKRRGAKDETDDDEEREDSHIDAQGRDADLTPEERAAREKAAAKGAEGTTTERPAHLQPEVPDNSAGNAAGSSSGAASAPGTSGTSGKPASASRGAAARKSGGE